MKFIEYLAFAALLVPTLVVAAAAVLSLTTSDPAPEYYASVPSASGAVPHPVEMTTDE